MMTPSFIAAPSGADYQGWFTQPYRTAHRYGYWRGYSRTFGGDFHDAIVTPPAH